MKFKIKCLFSIVLSLSVLLSAVSVYAAEDNHVHSRELVSVPSEQVRGVRSPGYFYCGECGEYYYSTLTSEDIGMPVINLDGSFAGMTKDNKVTVGFGYEDGDQNIDCNCTLKWQGSSSLRYEKKNFTMTLVTEEGKKNKVCFSDSWGNQSKYVLKANYIDYSQSRNIVSAKIFGQIVKSRNKGDRIEGLVNGGAIDGYPVAVYHNGVFHGLYTLNIPKDDWLFDMGDENEKECLLFGDDWSDSVTLNAAIVGDPADQNWDIEYCSTEDNMEIGTDWIAESFNRLINFVNTCTEEEFRTKINDYTDLDRVIDLYIYTVFIHANDNTSKNIIWATYDGEKWVPSAYDLDGTWGLRWDGELAYSPNDFGFDNYNKLWELVKKYCFPELKARYAELREDILSLANIKKSFSEFNSLIPEMIFETEENRWPEVKNHDTNNYDQIINFAARRIAHLDAYFGVRIIEKASLSNKINFSKPENAAFSVFNGIDTSAEPLSADSAWSVNARSGQLTQKNGVVYFRLEPALGYRVSNIIVSDDSCTVRLPEDTGTDNLYEIAGINSDVCVSFEISECEVDAYCVNFDVPQDVFVTVYDTGDLAGGRISDRAYSTDAQTGLPVKDGEGQVYFTFGLPEGKEIEAVEIIPMEGYKTLVGPDETGVENTYRITRVSSDLTVKLYCTGDEIPEIDYYTVTFETQDGTSVFVYPKQDYTLTPVSAFQTASVDSESGEPTASGDGQVNFLVDLPAFTEIETIEISPEDGYKNLKDPSETGMENVYRITKIRSDLTVSVKTVTHDYTVSYAPAEEDPSNYHNAFCECGKSIPEKHSPGEAFVNNGTAYVKCVLCGYRSLALLGDRDRDGTVSVMEARDALRAAIRLDHYESDSFDFAVLDIDGNAEITVEDSRLILRSAIKLENDLSVYHKAKEFIEAEEETTLPEEATTLPEEETTALPEEETTLSEETTALPEEETTLSEEVTTLPQEQTSHEDTSAEESTTASVTPSAEESTTQDISVTEETETDISTTEQFSDPEETTKQNPVIVYG